MRTIEAARNEAMKTAHREEDEAWHTGLIGEQKTRRPSDLGLWDVYYHNAIQRIIADELQRAING